MQYPTGDQVNKQEVTHAISNWETDTILVQVSFSGLNIINLMSLQYSDK